MTPLLLKATALAAVEICLAFETMGLYRCYVYCKTGGIFFQYGECNDVAREE